MFERPSSRWVDYSIEGTGGKFRVRIRDRDGQEHVAEFGTKTEARDYVEQFRRFPSGHEPAR